MMLVWLAALSAAPLAPLGPWSVDYDDGMCVMSRRFGDATSPVTLGLTSLPLSGAGTLTVKSRTTAVKGASSGKAVFRFEPGKASFPASFRRADLGDGHGTFVAIEADTGDDDPDLPGLFRQAQRFELVLGDDPVLAFQPIGGAGAVRALRECDRLLMTRWGVDTAVVDTAVVPPRAKGTVFGWMPQNVFALEDKARNVEGTTTMLWSIDATGRATACKVVVSSGDAALDRASCLAHVRARYTPARNAQGAPVMSFVIHRLRWMSDQKSANR